MSQKYVEIWEASKSSRNVLNLRMYCQLKVYDWVFLVGFGCWGVLNTIAVFSIIPISKEWIYTINPFLMQLLTKG